MIICRIGIEIHAMQLRDTILATRSINFIQNRSIEPDDRISCVTKFGMPWTQFTKKYRIQPNRHVEIIALIHQAE